MSYSESLEIRNKQDSGTLGKPYHSIWVGESHERMLWRRRASDMVY
jgi:hypothetical protein